MSHKIISHSFSVSGGNVTIEFNIEDSQEPPSHYNLNYIIRGETANVLMPTGLSIIVAGKWRTFISLTYQGRTELTGVFKIARFGVWSSTYKASNESEPEFSPTEYYPTYYPTVKHQWIWNPATNTYNLGQADNCVAHAITTLKEIHERREDKGTNFYSINWVYGNRASNHHQGEGMYTNEALERLQSQGVPLYSDMLDHNTIYPDNRHYADVGGLKGAKRIYEDSYANSTIRNKAVAQKITGFTEYIHKSANATAIKQAIMADGGVIVDFAIATNFDNVFWSINNGIVPEHPDSLTGGWHSMVIIGWKKINNKTYWICHNNWGNWADNGICYVPLDYVCFNRYFKVVDFVSPKWTRWTTKVKQGETFNITAQDWNDYIDFIKAAYTRNGWSIPTMTYVSSGQDFLATRFNEVKNAIGTRVGTGIANRSKDDDILASYFHTLESSGNQM